MYYEVRRPTESHPRSEDEMGRRPTGNWTPTLDWTPTRTGGLADACWRILGGGGGGTWASASLPATGADSRRR